MSDYWCIAVVVSYIGWFKMGMYFGKKKRDKDLYAEYKKRTDVGAEQLAIDVLVNRISNGTRG